MMKNKIKWQKGMPEQTGLYLVTLSTGKITAMVCHVRFASSPYWLGEYKEEGNVIAWCDLNDIEPYKE